MSFQVPNIWYHRRCPFPGKISTEFLHVAHGDEKDGPSERKKSEGSYVRFHRLNTEWLSALFTIPIEVASTKVTLKDYQGDCGLRCGSQHVYRKWMLQSQRPYPPLFVTRQVSTLNDGTALLVTEHSSRKILSVPQDINIDALKTGILFGAENYQRGCPHPPLKSETGVVVHPRTTRGESSLPVRIGQGFRLWSSTGTGGDTAGASYTHMGIEDAVPFEKDHGLNHLHFIAKISRHRSTPSSLYPFTKLLIQENLVIWKNYVEHDFVKQLAQGVLPRESFVHFVKYIVSLAFMSNLYVHPIDIKNTRAANFRIGRINLPAIGSAAPSTLVKNGVFST
ncbi:hypothetical protein IW262DRAFT_1292812 [Armillaria fumosa]|nr:hypothetical protein IW262DRAFT_1292812 [Armillaria fumosa]